MKKLILLSVLGLVLGLGGGTGVAIVMAPAATPDSAHAAPADSTSDGGHKEPTVVAAAEELATAPAAIPDSATTVAAHADSGASHDAGKPAVTTGADTKSQVAHADTSRPATSAPPPAAQPDSTPRIQLRRIARIFAAMSPREAAKVLVQLDDADVAAILGSLTEKQAAGVLTALPPDRAASISRGTLRPRTGPGQ